MVICGNNSQLYKKLSSKYSGSESIRIMSFVDNMPDYYSASDLAVMKPGDFLFLRLFLQNSTSPHGAHSGAGTAQYEYTVQRQCSEALKKQQQDIRSSGNIGKPALESMTDGIERFSRPSAAQDILEIITSHK